MTASGFENQVLRELKDLHQAESAIGRYYERLRRAGTVSLTTRLKLHDRVHDLQSRVRRLDQMLSVSQAIR
jgi:ferritin-like metal-binding protein YciE